MKKQGDLPHSSKRRSPGERVRSILLALCMVLTLLPTTALATEPTVPTAEPTAAENGVTAEPKTEEPVALTVAEPTAEEPNVISVTISNSTTNYTDHAEGWLAAVGASGAVTVKLLANWTAAPTNDNTTTSFGTGAGFGNKGYLLVPALKTITLDLNDYTIDRGLKETAVSDGKVIEVKGTLTLQDSGTAPAKQGKITGANSSNGGAVDVASGGGTFTMEGGSITDNNTAAGGVWTDCSFTMTGGSITGNTGSGANSVGGVFVASNGSFTMTGGSITDNTAVGENGAGGVYMEGGSTRFTMTGGSITGNTGGGAGGVLVIGNKFHNIFTVGGTAQITGNTLTGGTASNVLLQNIIEGSDNKTITCSDTTPLAPGATIGVTTQTAPAADKSVAITDQSSTNYSSYFFSDDPAYETRNSGESSNQVVQLSANLGSFAGGDGSASNPYQIADADQLSRLTAKVNNGEGNYVSAHYQLTADIVLTGFGNWIPIGNSTNAFKGNFDGNDKTITGLKVTGGNYSGLFGWIWDATVKNLTVSNGSVSGGQFTGAIVGYAVSSTIENCRNESVEVKGTSSDIGGIAGYLNSSTLSNSTNRAAVSSTANSVIHDVGGVVGMNSYKSTVANCVNYGAVTITGTSYSNGLGGVVGNNNSATVTNCANYGAVTNADVAQSGAKKTTGGVVGLNEGNEGTVTNCVNGGEVSGGTSPGYVGGVVGYNSKTTSVVQFSYTLSGDDKPGAVGENTGTITGCGTFTGTNGAVTLISDSSGGKTETYVPDGKTTALDTALNSWVSGENGKPAANFWKVVVEVGESYLVPTLPAVTFDATGGSAILKMATTSEGKLTDLPTPTRDGYTFDGWFTAASGGTKVEAATTTFDKNTTLYAHWTAAVAPPPPPPPPPTTDGGGSPSGGSDGYTPTQTTQLKAGGILTASNLDQLIAGGKDLTVTGAEGAKLVFDTDALRGINDQTSGGVKVDIKDVSAEHPDTHGGKTVFSLTVTSGGKTVSDFGGKVTISLPYTLKDGEKPEDVTVWHLADDGTMTEIPATYDPKTGLATATVSHFSQYVVGVWSNPFVDVQAGDWCYDAVKFVHKNGLFSGTSAVNFAPNASMNRAMLWMVLARQDGRDTTGGSPWYEIGMSWAKETGISDGTKPMDKLTREQLITMLWRYAGSPILMDDPGLSGYTDAGDISGFAQQAMAWAHQKGLVQGDGATLKPKQNASRAQVAAILMRYCQNVAQ